MTVLLFLKAYDRQRYSPYVQISRKESILLLLKAYDKYEMSMVLICFSFSWMSVSSKQQNYLICVIATSKIVNYLISGTIDNAIRFSDHFPIFDYAITFLYLILILRSLPCSLMAFSGTLVMPWSFSAIMNQVSYLAALAVTVLPSGMVMLITLVFSSRISLVESIRMVEFFVMPYKPMQCLSVITALFSSGMKHTLV